MLKKKGHILFPSVSFEAVMNYIQLKAATEATPDKQDWLIHLTFFSEKQTVIGQEPEFLKHVCSISVF